MKETNRYVSPNEKHNNNNEEFLSIITKEKKTSSLRAITFIKYPM
jgi:hypothetical protein